MSLHAHRFLDTPVGRIRVVAEGAALRAVHCPNQSEEPADAGPPATKHAVLDQVARELDEYFAKKRTRFSFGASTSGTPFQQRVWAELAKIPFGETRSYADIARGIGNPKAVRAVGLANGRNPLAIIVPCHRVIGADGTLTGYGGGLPMKKWLLAHEGRH